MKLHQEKLAELAGVSQSTVSRALQNSPTLPVSTRRRIQRLAAKHGYAQNPLVSSVFAEIRRGRMGRTLGTLAFLTAHATRTEWRRVATYRDFLEGAQERADQLGFQVEHHWAATPGLTGQRLSEILMARGISGIILSIRGQNQAFPSIDWSRFALARTGLSQGTLPVPCAVNNQSMTVRMVAKNLAERGYRRVGMAVTEWQNEVTNQTWLAGYLVHQHSSAVAIPPLIAPVITPDLLDRWIREHNLDAVMAVNPDVLRMIRGLGLKVPKDIGFALLDWHEAYGDIAGADQNSRQTGAAAVDIVVLQLRSNERGIPEHPQTVLIDSTWRDGGTV